MNEQTDKLIRDLAEKLGTTAEHLWGVLIKQAAVNSWFNILLWIAFLIGFIYSTAFLLGHFRKYKSASKSGSEDDPDDYKLGMIISGSVSLILIIVLISTLCTGGSETLSGFLNPEYWALKQIIH